MGPANSFVSGLPPSINYFPDLNNPLCGYFELHDLPKIKAADEKGIVKCGLGSKRVTKGSNDRQPLPVIAFGTTRFCLLLPFWERYTEKN